MHASTSPRRRDGGVTAAPASRERPVGLATITDIRVRQIRRLYAIMLAALEAEEAAYCQVFTGPCDRPGPEPEAEAEAGI